MASMLSVKAFVVPVCAVAGFAAAPVLAQGIGAGPGAPPSALRSVPAETTAALYEDPKWQPPRTSWGDPQLEGVWSVDDMRGIPRDRPESFGVRQSLTPDEFQERASRDQGGRNRAAETETFLRNEWGIRTFGFSSLVVDPPNGRTPPLTANGRARAAAAQSQGSFGPGPFDTFEDFSLYDRCIARGLSAGMSAVLYGNGIVIAQSPDSVTITYEMVHETRVIPLDGRPHLVDGVTQYNGNSRGFWDGDTLVVETRGFTNETSVGSAPNSTSLRTTERIRRVDPEMIEYRITIDDPVTYSAPFTVRTMWTTQPGYEVYEYSCHEGNYAVSGGLSGERAYEREVEEAKRKGLPIPRRATMAEIYGAPREDAEVFDINQGE